jgi:photosystem II stability/assembly factor-like uncharacterized protein
MASLQGPAVCRRHFAARLKRFRFILRLTPYSLLLSLLFVSAAGAGCVRQTSNTTYFLNDVCFVDSLYGWAVGGWSSPDPSDTTVGICLRTTNGGDTWTMVYDTTERSMMLSVSFANRNHGWMMGDSSFSLGTTDGGVTWSVLPQIGDYFSAFVLRFANDTLGYFSGGSYFYGMMEGSSIGRSADGGNTWTETIPYRYGKWLWGLDTFGPGWAWTGGGYDTLYRTTNAGGSWQGYSFPFQHQPYYGVAFGNTSYGVAVGYNGYILGTSDGGRSWAQRSSPTTQGLYGAEMPDPQHAWACGGGGTIIASTDGGMNWTAQVSGTRSQLRKIWFVDDRQGWAVGDSGVILHTEDGGRSGVWEDSNGRFQPLTSNLYLSVVPNPFVSFTSVPDHSSDRFALYDISGRKVGVYKGNKVGWDVSPGIYFLRPDTRSSLPDSRVLRIVKLR